MLTISLDLQLVEYKQNIRLEEKRKKVLDQHLNFIVNETEKYSSLLTEGLKQTPTKEVRLLQTVFCCCRFRLIKMEYSAYVK